ncbi:hypothetical protein BDV23DRAFT_189465 [Aspergillus alliaceus]|uniref:Uncharacterized protein n=1 Tax=Petromyces alliaceus TaxID=209559 RepID=A0A5N7BRC8_PETAA|nr:hypothetical protein BDV23DRAFT_189465 [Aspergillus alliaceus]
MASSRSVSRSPSRNPLPLLTYLREHNCIVCIGCKVALAGQLKERHLSDVYQLQTIADRARYLRPIPRDVTPRSSHDEFLPLPNGSTVIPELELHDLWECSHCGHLTRSRRISQQHQVAAHHADGLPWTPRRVQGQSWFQSSRYLRFWITMLLDPPQPAQGVPPDNPRSSPVADTLAMDEPRINSLNLDPVTGTYLVSSCPAHHELRSHSSAQKQAWLSDRLNHRPDRCDAWPQSPPERGPWCYRPPHRRNTQSRGSAEFSTWRLVESSERSPCKRHCSPAWIINDLFSRPVICRTT